MIKRIMTLFMVCIFFITTANALTTLNSCGYTNWTDGEVYEVDIPLVDSTTSASGICFDLTGIDNLSLTFNSLSDTTIKDRTMFRFHYNVERMTLNNFNINVDETSSTSDTNNLFIRVDETPELDTCNNALEGTTAVGYEYYDFNITMNNFSYKSDIYSNVFWALGEHGDISACSYSERNTYQKHFLENLEMNNIWVETKGSLFFQEPGFSISTFLTNDPRRYGGISFVPKIDDSLMITDIYTKKGWETYVANSVEYNRSNVLDSINTLINSVVISDTPQVTGADFNNTANSIIKGYRHNDTNDDNFADTDPYTGISTARMYKDLFGYRFIQDFQEGQIGYVTDTGLDLVLVNDVFNTGLDGEIYQGVSNNDLDISINEINFAERNGLRLLGSKANIDCSMISSNKCLINDNSSDGIISLDRYKAFINTEDSITINNVFFESKAQHNMPMISNFNDNEYFTLNIRNNIFETNNSQYLELDDTGDGSITQADLEGSKDYIYPLVKARYGGVNIHDNTFRGLNNSPVSRYNYLFIDSSLPTTNNVFDNYFYNNITNPDNNSYVFTYSADTNFYHNYVGANMDIAKSTFGEDNTSIDYSNLATNGTYAYFNEFDNEIYYFNLGNYYEDNTGCTDSDGDSICDSPYVTDEGIIDERALAVYPYDFSNNLFEAEYSVSTDYQVSTTQPNDGEVVVIQSGTDAITLGFSQNSDIEGLTCELLLDNQVLETFYNPEKNVEYTFDKSGWNEASYEYKVFCYEQTTAETQTYSTPIVFSVDIDSTATDPDDELDDTIANGTNYDLGQLFSSDPQVSANGLLDLFNLTGSFMGYLLLISFVGIFIGIIVAIFALVGRLIK